jgi:D-aminopeptidase
VRVGQVEVVQAGLRTGITAVVPYPPQVEERKLFIGRWAVDGGDILSGLGVAEDFGTFSSPVVLAPAPAKGRVYEALIQHGLARDPGLTTVAGWPPVVVGLDQATWGPALLVHQVVGQPHLDAAVGQAREGAVREGNAGIGAGLRAFGVKGGIGTSSRRVDAYLVGALVAANGGSPRELRVDGYPIGNFLRAGQGEPQTFAAVVATDAPLIPGQLDRLAGRAALGLGRVGLLNAATREGLVLAFSTAGQAEEGPLEVGRMATEKELYGLFAAAAQVAEEAVLNALLAAEPVEADGQRLATLPHSGWPEQTRRFQEQRR